MDGLFKRIVLVLLVFPLTGCPPPQLVEIYNNTSEDLVVLINGNQQSWKRNTVLQVGDIDTGVNWKDLQWLEINNRRAPLLTVLRKGEQQSYALIAGALPQEFFDASGKAIEVKYQLEADGRLFVIQPAQTFPVDDIPTQPAAYPVTPIDVARIDS